MKVIIAQAHQFVIDEIKSAVEIAGNNTIFTTTLNEALWSIPSNGSYLLITGMVFKKADDGITLCNEARAKNNNGKVVLLTTMPKNEELFDAFIRKSAYEKDKWLNELKEFIMKAS
jgi:DNA-binding NarL/FixJ family response regulator